jgi:hypothetical protein
MAADAICAKGKYYAVGKSRRWLVVLLCVASPVWAADSGLEYRLKVPESAKEGVPFAFDHAEEQYFSPLPFMTAADFTGARARPSKNPNTPGDWELVLTHSAIGRAKFRAVADADRSGDFCIVFRGTLYQCEAFPPVVKGVYDKDRSFGDRLTQAMAMKLARDMAAEIRRAHSNKATWAIK